MVCVGAKVVVRRCYRIRTIRLGWYDGRDEMLTNGNELSEWTLTSISFIYLFIDRSNELFQLERFCRINI